MSLLNTAEK